MSITRLSCFVSTIVIGVAGCVSDSPTKPEIPPQAADARPTTLQVVAGNARDANGNGFADTVSVTVFLWDEQRSPIPLSLPGSFAFQLSRPDGSILAQWDFDEPRTAAARVRMPAGPAYVFDLTILGQASDNFDTQQVELSGTFVPSGGKPIRSASGTGLRFGKTGA